MTWVRICAGEYMSWPAGWTISGEGRNWKVEGRGFEGAASSWAEAKALAEKIEFNEALNDEAERQEALRMQKAEAEAVKKARDQYEEDTGFRKYEAG